MALQETVKGKSMPQCHAGSCIAGGTAFLFFPPSHTFLFSSPICSPLPHLEITATTTVLVTKQPPPPPQLPLGYQPPKTESTPAHLPLPLPQHHWLGRPTVLTLAHVRQRQRAAVVLFPVESPLVNRLPSLIQFCAILVSPPHSCLP